MFNRKATPDFTTLFADVKMTGSIHLNASSKAVFDNMAIEGAITGPGNIVAAESGEVRATVTNSTLLLTSIVGVNHLNIGVNTKFIVKGENEAVMEFDTLVIEGQAAEFQLLNGTVVAKTIRIGKGGSLAATRIECRNVILETGGHVDGYVTTRPADKVQNSVMTEAD